MQIKEITKDHPAQFGGSTLATRIQYVRPPQQRCTITWEHFERFPERAANSQPERPTPDNAEAFVGGWIMSSFRIRLAY